MKNPLNKRIKRELKSEIGKYLSLFLFLTLTIGFVSGFLVAGGSMKTAYDESFDKYKIEDGHFSLAMPANDDLIKQVEDKDVSVSKLYYKNFELEDKHNIRVYKDRKDIDKICLMEGKMPKSDNDIVIDRLYAENNEISVGDKIKVDGKNFNIRGFVAFSDYSALFKNTTDMMFDAKKFTIACVTDNAFEKLGNEHLIYNYAWRNNDQNLSDTKKSDKGDEIKDVLAKSGMLTDFIKATDNQAIIFTGDDIGGDRIMVITMLYIIMAVLAFIFGITTRNTIEKEAGTIGTLRASGYTKGEIVRHYMILPILVTFVAAVIGNILGYTFMKNIVVGMYYHSYSLPTYVTLWNGEAFVLTTLIPALIVIAVVLAVLIYTLKLSPLQFLRHELNSKKKNKVMKLKHFKFLTRFRLRVIFQNVSSYLTLFLGVIFASILLLFGMMMSPLLSHFKDSVINSKIADYQYVLKAPVETKNQNAEKYSVCSLETDTGEEITIYGIDSNSKYLNKKLDNNTVLFSDGFMEKYGIEKNDKYKLKEKYKNKSYEFTVDDKYDYPATLAVFMSRDNFNKTFDKDKDYYCGYLSNEKLTDIDQNYIATTITESDLTVMADQLDDSMGQMFLLLCGFAVIIYVLLMYLLAKQITEKNIQAISMVKILGYNNKEISTIYNITTGIVMMLSLVLSVPISYYLINIIYYAMMKDYNGWLDLYYAPWIWPLMVAIGAVCYIAVHFIQMKRIKKIPMSEALKNME